MQDTQKINTIGTELRMCPMLTHKHPEGRVRVNITTENRPYGVVACVYIFEHNKACKLKEQEHMKNNRCHFYSINLC